MAALTFCSAARHFKPREPYLRWSARQLRERRHLLLAVLRPSYPSVDSGLDCVNPPGMAAAWLETRTSLVGRLRDSADAPSWEAFVDSYGRVIFSVASKAGLSPEDAQDVTQETLIAVARRIQGFDPDRNRGPIKAWLLTIAHSRIVDCFRRRGPVVGFPPPTDSTQTAWIERVPDSGQPRIEDLWEAAWRVRLYEVARLDRGEPGFRHD